jgi:hypothetical protein
MKLTIEVDNKAIEQAVTEAVTNQLASELYKELRGSRGDRLSYNYHTEIREIIRQVMRENYDSLAKEAVSAAAKSIENRALKEKIKAVLEGNE